MNASFHNDRYHVSDIDSKANRNNLSFALEKVAATPQNERSMQRGPDYTVTVDDIVKSTLRKSPFGIDLYNVPKVERAYLLKPHQGKIDKSKRINFVETEANLRKYVPGPSQYQTV